jgi:molybdate transport system regulatory protein
MTEVDLLINIKFNRHIFITPERIKLLRMIKQTGSLNAASKEIPISYQNAWTIVNEINKLAPNPLVIKQRGGSGGGGAEISEYGNLILKEYSFIEQQIQEFTQKLNIELNL